MRNSGAAFGFASGLTVVLSLVAAAVVVVILRARNVTAQRVVGRWRSASCSAAQSATCPTAIFRDPGVFRGRVIDFIELPHWPLFNLADSCIVTGGALMVLLSVRGVRHDGRVVTRPSEDPPAPARD